MSVRHHKRGPDLLYETAHAAFGREMVRLREELSYGFIGSKVKMLEWEELVDYLDIEHYLMITFSLLAMHSSASLKEAYWLRSRSCSKK